MFVSINQVCINISAHGYWNAYHALRTDWARSRWDSVWLLWIAAHRLRYQRLYGVHQY